MPSSFSSLNIFIFVFCSSLPLPLANNRAFLWEQKKSRRVKSLRKKIYQDWCKFFSFCLTKKAWNKRNSCLHLSSSLYKLCVKKFLYGTEQNVMKQRGDFCVFKNQKLRFCVSKLNKKKREINFCGSILLSWAQINIKSSEISVKIREKNPSSVRVYLTSDKIKDIFRHIETFTCARDVVAGTLRGLSSFCTNWIWYDLTTATTE